MNQLSKWLLLMVGLPTHSADGCMPGLCLKDSPPRRPYLTSYDRYRASEAYFNTAPKGALMRHTLSRMEVSLGPLIRFRCQAL